MHRRSLSTWFGKKEVSSWPQVDKVMISHILRHLPENSLKVRICELCSYIKPLDYEEVSPKNLLCDNSSKDASTQTFTYL